MTDETPPTRSDLERRAERAVARSRRLLDRAASEHASTAADEDRVAAAYDDLTPSAQRTGKALRARERGRDARERARDSEDRRRGDTWP